MLYTSNSTDSIDFKIRDKEWELKQATKNNEYYKLESIVKELKELNEEKESHCKIICRGGKEFMELYTKGYNGLS